MDKDDTTKATSEVTEAERLLKFPFRIRTSAYNFEITANHPGYGLGLTLREDGTSSLETRCIPSYDAIDLSGGSVTNSAGQMTWRLSNSVCVSEGLSPDFPVSFVATPISDKPGYITVKFKAIEMNDIVIDVFSWDNLGNLAPSMYFYWRCRIPLTYTIYRKPSTIDTQLDTLQTK